MIRPSRTTLIRSLRRGLEERAAALSRSVSSDLEELGRSGEEHHLADLDDLGGDALDQEATFALMQLEAEQLEQIRWALERIDAGTYGVCEDCGREIHEERLIALPLATRCVRCQSAAEAGATPALRAAPGGGADLEEEDEAEAEEAEEEEEEEAEEAEEAEEEAAADERFARLETEQALAATDEEEEEGAEEERGEERADDDRAGGGAAPFAEPGEGRP